ncbi:MAG: hypothetical protein C0501_14735 [Isosphaera sp.]|nr:hypothetical protein [Isosphaera sp.]
MRRGGPVRRAVRAFAAVAARRRLAVALVGLLAAGGAAARCALAGPPLASIHDEFSYLLGADTFARGRLTNPPPAAWPALESIHILVRPTYSSKYPPGQALFLAAGQRLGHPVVGVWASHALACAALCWLLQGWVSARWALAGAVTATARLTFGGEPFLSAGGTWAYGYMGGSVAMLGGCLVYGAYPRLTTRPRAWHGLALGAGLALLAVTRPFEGLVTSLPAAAGLFAHLVRRRPPRRVVVRCAAAAAVPLAATAGFVLAHSRAVTGDPLLLPYQEHARQYEPAPVFHFQPPRPEPEYRHASIRGLHAEWAYGVYETQRSAAGRAVLAGEKLGLLWEFFLGPVLTVPLLAVPWAWGRRGVRLAAAVVGLLLVTFAAVSVWSANHYAAPAAGVTYLLVTRGLERLARWGGWRRWAVAAVLGYSWVGLPAWHLSHTWPPGPGWPRDRTVIADDLAAGGGRHLVVVRYGPGHSPHTEWVYNAADPAGAAVVWAHDLGPEWNARLREAYPGRRYWRLYADEEPPRLEEW